jgi:histidinol-phosphatase
MDDEMHAEVAAVERHRERVDDERHVIDDDVDRRVPVRRRVDVDDSFAGRATRRDVQMFEEGTSKGLRRPGREVVIAELFVVRTDERVGVRDLAGGDQLADSRDHGVATGHVADHIVHILPIGVSGPSRMLAQVDTAEALELALELADVADGITMARFRASDLKVETKPDLTPVSEADQGAERALRDRLATYEGHVVLGEEYGFDPGDGTAEYRWIIDPIDGTKNYVRGVPIWATLIGVERAGALVVGVASAPALGMRWWAGRGLGAFRNGEPITVSGVSEIGDAQVSFAWDTEERFHAEGIGEKLVALSHRCWRTRGIGDFWQHLLVAEGAFDIAIDPIVGVWDIAALIPIVEEAGGRWSGVDGITDIEAGSFVCTNGRLHDTVLASLA